MNPNKFSSLLPLGLVALCSVSYAQSQTTIVDFGGSSAYVGSSPTHIVFNGYTATGKSFDLNTPFNPSANYTVPSGKSGVFYGGASVVSVAGTGQWNTASGLTFRNDLTTPAFGSEDALRFYPSWASTLADGDQRFYSAVVFKKADFLNGMSSQTVAFDASSSYSATVALGSGYQASNNRFRIVVQDGSNWYISQAIALNAGNNVVQTISNTTFASRTWSDYNPSISLSAIGASATPAFTNVTAVGFQFELSSLKSVNGGSNGGAWVNDFVVSAIPEPGAFAMVGGLMALACVGMRRRRAG